MDLAILCLAGLLFAFINSNQEKEHSEKKKRNFRAAEYCQQCHPREYEQWSRSAHSYSFKGSIFQNFFNQFLNDIGTENKRICLKCHAPAAVFNDDVEMKVEGDNSPVSCEVCHTLTGYDADYRLMFDTEGNMFSTGEAALGEGHMVYKNSKMGTSEWCAPCHTAVNPKIKNMVCSQDIRYNSWKENTGRSEQCQSCHMRDKQGNVDHTFRGISDPSLLENVLKVRWDVSILPENYKVKVIIYNDKIAHLFPAGMSMKRIVIEAALLNNESKTIYKQEAFLGRLYEDRDGIWPVPGWRGTKIRIDNAISPLESRMMVFNLPIAANVDSISLRIYYSRYPDDKEQPVIFSEQKPI